MQRQMCRRTLDRSAAVVLTTVHRPVHVKWPFTTFVTCAVTQNCTSTPKMFRFIWGLFIENNELTKMFITSL